jgi:hypothetical protein
MEEDRYTRITLRLPKELHARLDGVADKTSKSLNAEIVGRLEASFSTDGEPMSATLVRELQRTQRLLTLNRLETAYRVARDAELHAQRAMANAILEGVTGAERSEIELTYQGARAEAVSARADLESFTSASRYVEEELDGVDGSDATGVVPMENSEPPLLRRKLVGDLGSDEHSTYNKLIIRQQKPVAPSPANHGPTRSPNARKPKP